MGRMVVSLLALMVPLGGLGLVAATGPEDVKPVAVLSVGSVESAMRDIAFVGRLTDNPHLADGIEAVGLLLTRGQGIPGVDYERPCGAVALTNGNKVAGYAFVPVDDAAALREAVARLVKIDDAGDGVYKVHTKDGPLFVAEKTPGWLIVSKHRRVLDLAEGDPAVLLGDLFPRYDVGLRVYVENIPERFRDGLVRKIRRGHERDAARRDGESEHEYAMRKAISGEAVGVVLESIEQIERVELGWTLDPEAEDARLELTLTAKPGTPIAEAAAQLDETTSRFAGFASPHAALSANWAGPIPSHKRQAVDAMLAAVREHADDQIAQEHAEQGKSDEETRIAQQLVADVVDVLDRTTATGKTDGGAAVLLGPDAGTLLIGMQVVEVEKLDGWARKMATFATAEHPELAGLIHFDADREDDVRFHTVTLPIDRDEKDREKLVRLVGERLEVAVGVGDRALYLAAGRDALEVLKQAVAASADAAEDVVEPLRASLALKPVARFVAEFGDTEPERTKAAAVAALLDEIGDDARLELRGTGVERGVRYQFRVSPGVLELFGRLYVSPRLDGAR